MQRIPVPELVIGLFALVALSTTADGGGSPVYLTLAALFIPSLAVAALLVTVATSAYVVTYAMTRRGVDA